MLFFRFFVRLRFPRFLFFCFIKTKKKTFLKRSVSAEEHKKKSLNRKLFPVSKKQQKIIDYAVC